jgi:hypothetical protein
MPIITKPSEFFVSNYNQHYYDKSDCTDNLRRNHCSKKKKACNTYLTQKKTNFFFKSQRFGREFSKQAIQRHTRTGTCTGAVFGAKAGAGAGHCATGKFNMHYTAASIMVWQ